MRFEDAFVDELRKVAGKNSYLFSQMAANPAGLNTLLPSLIGAKLIGGSLMSPLGLIGGLAGGALATGRGVIGRTLHARGLLGRARKGGKALFGHEKKRLAEMTDMSPEDLEGALSRLGETAKAKKLSTFPISRFMTHPAQVSPLWTRLIGTRNLAGKAAMGKKLLPDEWKLLEEVKAHKKPIGKPSLLRSILGALKKRLVG